MTSEFNQKLQNIGLTEREARVYLFLSEYKEAKTGVICSNLNIRSSHIYTILDKLLRKGLISYKIINNIKIFHPVDPKSLYALFKEKERKLKQEEKEVKEFITSMKKIETKDIRQNDFKYFEGANGIKSMFTEFSESWQMDSKMYIFSAPITYEDWTAFFMESFRPPRIKKNIHLSILLTGERKQPTEERKVTKLRDVRYINTEIESEFGVCGDYVYFLSSGDKPYALLIKDKNLASTQVKIFKLIWKTAKKEPYK